jgi:hypothetical protein
VVASFCDTPNFSANSLINSFVFNAVGLVD